MIYFLKLRDNIYQLFNLDKTKSLSSKFSKLKSHTTHVFVFVLFFLKLHLIKLIFYYNIKLQDS